MLGSETEPKGDREYFTRLRGIGQDCFTLLYVHLVWIQVGHVPNVVDR